MTQTREVGPGLCSCVSLSKMENEDMWSTCTYPLFVWCVHMCVEDRCWQQVSSLNIRYLMLFPFFFFWNYVDVDSPGWPGTHSISRLSSKLQRSACLCLLSAGIKEVKHLTSLTFLFMCEQRVFACMYVFVHHVMCMSGVCWVQKRVLDLLGLDGCELHGAGNWIQVWESSKYSKLLSQHSSPHHRFLFLRQWTWSSLTQLCWLANEPHRSTSSLSSPALGYRWVYAWLFRGTGDPNSCPHACKLVRHFTHWDISPAFTLFKTGSKARLVFVIYPRLALNLQQFCWSFLGTGLAGFLQLQYWSFVEVMGYGLFSLLAETEAQRPCSCHTLLSFTQALGSSSLGRKLFSMSYLPAPCFFGHKFC